MAPASGKGLLTVPKHDRASPCGEACTHDRRDQGGQDKRAGETEARFIATNPLLRS